MLCGIENSFKAYHGEEEALVDPALIVAARKKDADLKARVAKDAGLAAATGDPWSDIARAQMSLKALYMRYGMTESRAGFGSDLFGYARRLVRAAQERAKPNSERLPEYTDSRLALLSKTILDHHPVYPELEQMALNFWLSKLRENLTADSSGTKLFLGKDSPESLSARLAKSRLGDPKIRKALWDGGMAAIRASNDPMIKYVLATDGMSRAVRKDYENRVTGPVDRAAQKIAAARFCDLRHQHLSRRHLQPETDLWKGRGLERQWRHRAGHHLLQGTVGAGDGTIPLRADAALEERAGQSRFRHGVRFCNRQ